MAEMKMAVLFTVLSMMAHPGRLASGHRPSPTRSPAFRVAQIYFWKWRKMRIILGSFGQAGQFGQKAGPE
jgi:hypothetical protein